MHMHREINQGLKDYTNSIKYYEKSLQTRNLYPN